MRKLKTRRTRTTAQAPAWAHASPFDLDRIRELETENALLRARVADLHRRLDVVAAETGPSPIRAGHLSLVDDDGLAPDDRDLDEVDDPDEAFEAFLAIPDPDIDRVRRFLLG